MLKKSNPKPVYRLKFVPAALDEWKALDDSVKEILRKLLKKRLVDPRVPGAELRGELENCYKIKLRKQGYRLIYEVIDNEIVVLVLAMNRREGSIAYSLASKRRT
jgi:mRNA interferase RelE/StbE